MLFLLGVFVHLVLDSLHPPVQLGADFGTLIQVVPDLVCHILRNILLIAYLMLKASPPVHGDGPELHLHLHHLLPVVEEYRYLYYKMEAPVTVGLRILDIVLLLHQLDVILLKESL